MRYVEWIWEAYLDLNTCRQVGMDMGPIPWTAAKEYAQHHGMNAADLGLLWTCIRRMEDVRAEYLETERKRKSKSSGSQKRNTGSRTSR